MIFHLCYELPKPADRRLDHETPGFTEEEQRIIRQQIRKNTAVIDGYIRRLDLLVNKERYPRQAVFIQKIRRQLELLIEENDTFRRVLWQHLQQAELVQNYRQQIV